MYFLLVYKSRVTCTVHYKHIMWLASSRTHPYKPQTHVYVQHAVRTQALGLKLFSNRQLWYSVLADLKELQTAFYYRH